jgi:hypothetical protein
MQFGERHSQLLPFCEYMFAPGKSPVEGARGSVVVKALCYKPEGRGFETR